MKLIPGRADSESKIKIGLVLLAFLKRADAMNYKLRRVGFT